MRRQPIPRLSRLVLATLVTTIVSAPVRSAEVIEFQGYPNCIRLQNQNVRVTLCPVGGRVLEYSWKGKNALYLAPDDRGDRRDRAPWALTLFPLQYLDLGCLR